MLVAARPGYGNHAMIREWKKMAISMAGSDLEERQRRLDVIERWEKVRETVCEIEQRKKRQEAPWDEIAQGYWTCKAIIRQIGAACHYRHYAERSNMVYETTWYDEQVRRPEERVLVTILDNPYAAPERTIPRNEEFNENLARTYAHYGMGGVKERTSDAEEYMDTSSETSAQ